LKDERKTKREGRSEVSEMIPPKMLRFVVSAEGVEGRGTLNVDGEGFGC
jgi:hypothetical protein